METPQEEKQPIAYRFMHEILYCELCRSAMMKLERPRDGKVRVKCFGFECPRYGKTYEIEIPSVPMKLVEEPVAE